MYETATASDGTEISYRVFGSGPKDVILVHGWMVSGAVYDDLIEALGVDGVRLIVPDLRGTGKSGRPTSGFTIEQYAKDVVAVADAAGARSFVLVGHSMGGQIAQKIAAIEPARVKGAVLICPVPAAGLTLPPDAHALFRNSAGKRDMQAMILGAACKDISERAKERLLDDAGGLSEACIQGAYDSWTAGGFAGELGAITAPVLVVATDDPFLPPEFLRKEVVSPIRRASLAYVPGPGHYAPVERPRETAAVVRAFLAPLA